MKNIFSSIILKKLSISFFLLFIYVVGSRISLPFVDLNSRDFLGGTTAYLAFSTALTGGNLRSLSLFSIGLSPWMSAMILWTMLSLFKGLTGGGKEAQYRGEVSDCSYSVSSCSSKFTYPIILFNCSSLYLKYQPVMCR